MRNKPPASRLFQTRDFLLEADVAFQMTRSIVGDDRVLYASGPLDSGPRLYRLMNELGVPDQGEVVRKIGLDEFRRRVREPNEQELSRFSRQLRITRGDMVIDPGILKVPDWSGGHYSYFFLEVIRKFAREIWLMDGWELSSGATKEFVAALHWDVPCYSRHGVPVAKLDGRKILTDSLAWVESMGLDSPKLRERLTMIESAP